MNSSFMGTNHRGAEFAEERIRGNQQIKGKGVLRADLGLKVAG
jgi:hypothetical protein